MHPSPTPRKSFDGQSHPALALPALLIANVALACGPWMVRLAVSESHIGPVGAGFWRMALAIPVLLIAARRAGEPPIPRRAWLIGLVALGGLFFAADLAVWHIGLIQTRLANATLLGNITAVLFPIYGFIAARTWPERRQMLAVTLAIAGAGVLLGRSYELSARNITGDLLCILAGLFYTGYLIAVGRARQSIGPIGTLTIAVIAGTPALLVYALAIGEPIWPDDWMPLVLMSLGSQLIGQGLILWSVSRTTPLVVGITLLLQPVVAAAIGWIVYGERLHVLDGVGAIAIATAVLLVRSAPGRPPVAKALPADEHGLVSGA